MYMLSSCGLLEAKFKSNQDITRRRPNVVIIFRGTDAPLVLSFRVRIHILWSPGGAMSVKLQFTFKT